MLPRPALWCRVSVLAGLLLAGCSEVREPILVDGGVITIENTSDKEWKNIKLGLKDFAAGDRVEVIVEQSGARDTAGIVTRLDSEQTVARSGRR